MTTALISLIVIIAILLGLFLIWQSVTRYLRFSQRESGILESTSKEAQEILSSISDFKKTADNKVSAMLDKTIESYASVFEESINEAKQKLVSQIAEAGQRSQADLLKMLEEESKEFQTFLDRSQASFTKFFRQQTEQVNQDLKVYKKERMLSLDDQVKEEVDRLAIKVFGKSLTDSDHQQLITKSLENAKKQLKI